MSQELIIQYCSPTLAGLKVGSLFTCPYESNQQLNQLISQRNHALGKKGIAFAVLRRRNGRALIYVYRIKFLEKLLNCPKVQNFLAHKGYDTFVWEDCKTVLITHLSQEDFPHEIGIFLGYPLPDIEGFIANHGANYKCVGCWKVYSHEEEARRIFATFDACTKDFTRRLALGSSIIQLAVAV